MVCYTGALKLDICLLFMFSDTGKMKGSKTLVSIGNVRFRTTTHFFSSCLSFMLSRFAPFLIGHGLGIGPHSRCSFFSSTEKRRGLDEPLEAQLLVLEFMLHRTCCNNLSVHLHAAHDVVTKYRSVGNVSAAT